MDGQGVGPHTMIDRHSISPALYLYWSCFFSCQRRLTVHQLIYGFVFTALVWWNPELSSVPAGLTAAGVLALVTRFEQFGRFPAHVSLLRDWMASTWEKMDEFR